MSMLRKIQRVGKRATKFQYTATYQSVVVECLRDKWRPNKICVSWTRKGRRLITKLRPWQQSPDNNARGVVIWPEPEIMDITVTLYKGPKDKTYETKEWEFAVIDVDSSGKRKVLATTSINMVRYASSMPYDHDLHLRLKPTSRKIKTVMLEVSLTSNFLKEGKATDDDMISLASMMSVSNLSTIGFLEDEDDDYYWTGGRSITPPMVPQEVLSTDQLLKWSQEVTANVPSVKITNMTTSWRSGLGFLAIICYYRPDLVHDFDMLSPNTLKDNNILAFEIARSLGIACTLTPNMMVTATVPDKLAVTSFVYQMYQYFNKATQSAITRQTSRNVGSGANSPTDKSPSSPFDITKFEIFNKSRGSPVASPPPDVDKVNMYSRHSQDNSQTDIQAQPATQRTPRSISPILAQQGLVPAEQGVGPVLEQNEPGEKPTSTVEGYLDHSSPVSAKDKDEKREEEEKQTVSPRTSGANLKLDELVREHAHLLRPAVGEEESSTPDLKISSEDSVIKDDRALEFENPLDTDESISEPPSTSTASLLDDDDSRIPELPLDDVPTTTHQNESPRKSAGRKLPSVPTEVAGSVEDSKREERRRRAKEMLRKHRIDALRIPSSITNMPSSSTTKDSKYRQQAIDLLGKAFGTPETARRVRIPRSDDDDGLTSEGSSTSLGPTGSSNKLVSRPRSATVSSGVQRSSKSETHLQPRTEREKGAEDEVAPQEKRSRSHSLTNNTLKQKVNESESRPASDKHHGLEDRLSDNQLKDSGQETSPSDAVVQESASKETSRTSANQKSSSARPSSIAHKQKRKHVKPLPTPRPVQAKPSNALKHLVEQKKEEEELKSTSAPQSQTDGAQVNDNENTETNHVQNGSIENGPTGSDATGTAKEQNPAIVEGSPSKKKTLPSPAWSEHDDELSKDILVTQSEYVKEELIRLRHNLQELEDRAVTIETDIRNAMSEGDRGQEENLMREWFGILNKKNELIKRQMELNFIEKEEDLEKRQFFINRELRPLMEITEDDKTPAQKDREAHLLRELLELIDERDVLERKRMTTERLAHHERAGVAKAQAESANIVQGTTHLSSRQSSKDCVIQ